MTDTWKDILDVKSKQSSLRERIRKRKQELQNIEAELKLSAPSAAIADAAPPTKKLAMAAPEPTPPPPPVPPQLPKDAPAPPSADPNEPASEPLDSNHVSKRGGTFVRPKNVVLVKSGAVCFLRPH